MTQLLRLDPLQNRGNSNTTDGVIIVGLFVVSWVLSTIIHKVMRYDDFEITIAPSPVNEGRWHEA